MASVTFREFRGIHIETYFSRWLHPESINPLFLYFRDRSWERPYIKEPDPLFKFYIAATFAVLNAMVVILLLTEEQ
jgi:adenylate cyclase